MVNRMNQIFFSLSSSAPVLFCFAIVWYFQKQDYIWPIVAVALGVLMTLYAPIFIVFCKKKVQTITAKINKVEKNNYAVWGYVISYLVPIAGVIGEEVNILVTVIILVVLGILLPICNFVFPNPILLVCGYSFYKAETIDGADGYCLISKRKKISNASSIKYVQNIFSYYLIEKE